MKNVKCDVCGELKEDGQENNAHPVVKGRCCDKCNLEVNKIRDMILNLVKSK